ncbi:unnamed protein product, partial [Discosporangium mesarthrocarpum]
IEHEFVRDEVCVISIKGTVSVENQTTLNRDLCKLLSDMYEGPVKLVVFQGNLDREYPNDFVAETSVQGSFIVNQTQADMVKDLISKAPYFSLYRVAGCIEDLCADIAISCDWRLMSDASQLCFAAHRSLNEVKIAARLAELVGCFRAFDMILRRRIISAREALESGLALPESQVEDVAAVLEKQALTVRKESIAIMRRAVRAALPNDISVERIVSSVAVAS